MADKIVSSPLPSTWGIPISIVIAGGLIALAIYLGGTQKPPVVAGAPSPVATSPGAPQLKLDQYRPIDANDHIRGATSARVTVIEYSDTECPFCKQFHPMMQQLLADYPRDVRWVYRHLPLPQLHQQAAAEANATECAAEQGKFWEFLDHLYSVTPSNDGLNLADLPALAGSVGVGNIPQFQECVASEKYAQRVKIDVDDATKIGLSATPSNLLITRDGAVTPFIGSARSYDVLKAEIDKLLK